MESIGDARSFLSAAREVALTKPIIVIKAGRTEAAAKAAASHTGCLTGSDEVLDAAFRRCGVLRVDDIADLFNMAEVLAKQPRPRGPRLAIVTNAGGPGVLATDALIADGGELAEPAPETIDALNAVLPAAWSHGNPVDILGDAGPDRYAKALEIVAKDPEQRRPARRPHPPGDDRPDPDRRAVEAVCQARRQADPGQLDGRRRRRRRATTSSTGPASRPSPTPTPPPASSTPCGGTATTSAASTRPRPAVDDGRRPRPDRDAAEAIVRAARSGGRTILTEYESKRLLAAYGIPTVETVVATDEDAAVAAAERIGYPVVLKLHSETITHKTDVGGVKLNLADADAVRKAFRAIQESVTRARSAPATSRA